MALTGFRAISAMAMAMSLPLAAQAGETAVTFTANNSIQLALISQVPTGTFKPTNNFPVSFSIPVGLGATCPPTYNFWDSDIAQGQPLVVTTAVAKPVAVYTLMNAYHPYSGSLIGSIEFIGSNGALDVQPIVAGTNIRDFYQGDYANSINGTTAQNAFTAQNVQGGGGTGNVTTGDTGTYVIDEQKFTLPAAFQTQTLTRIIIIPMGGGNPGYPILLGITVAY
jgi:hypothetical protein